MCLIACVLGDVTERCYRYRTHRHDRKHAISECRYRNGFGGIKSDNFVSAGRFGGLAFGWM